MKKKTPAELKSHVTCLGFPGGSGVKSLLNAEDTGEVGWIPGSGSSRGEGRGNPRSSIPA